MVLTRSAAARQAQEEEPEEDPERNPEGKHKQPQGPRKGPDPSREPYNPNEELELETSLKDVKRIMREETKQCMGVIIAPSPVPKNIKDKRVIGEVYQDSIAESQGDTSIEETACIIAAIAKKEPNNIANTNREELKRQQDQSPDIQSAIRALKLNDKETIRRTWEKTPPKQRNPTQQFLLRQIQELNMDRELLVVTGRNRATKTCRWVLPPDGLERQIKTIHQTLAHPGRDRLTWVTKKYVLGPDFSRICKKVVLECEECQRTTDAITQNETRTAPYKAATPWEAENRYPSTS